MSREVDEIIARFLDRMPGAANSYYHDPTYHAQFTFMKRVLYSVDMAMEDEGVDQEIRNRIMRSVLFATPEPDERLIQISKNWRLQKP
jgi:hypothetical protein